MRARCACRNTIQRRAIRLAQLERTRPPAVPLEFLLERCPRPLRAMFQASIGTAPRPLALRPVHVSVHHSSSDRAGPECRPNEDGGYLWRRCREDHRLDRWELQTHHVVPSHMAHAGPCKTALETGAGGRRHGVSRGMVRRGCRLVRHLPKHVKV